MELGHIDELAALLALARQGSFVKAGRKLQRHPTIISKRVAALERRLGVRLVERTTRSVRLTQAGERLAEQVGLANELISQAEEEASLGASEPRGLLRLALPAAMGRMWIAPLLHQFLQQYPQIEIDVNFDERFIDLVSEGTDVAIRIGTLNDSRLIARKLADHQRVLCASSGYLAEFGRPETPSDLARHNCLVFSGFRSFPEWHLSDGSRIEKVTARGSFRSNDSPALLEAARAGVGILGAGEWLVAKDLAEGRLERALPGWTFDAEGGVFLVRPSARHTPAHVAAFAEWIVGKFRHGPPWAVAARGA